MNEVRQRYLRGPVEEDLKGRMVFIGGPRQVGKTVFAQGFLTPPDIMHPAYLNWDDVQVRSSLMKGELPAGQPVIILDEIHKSDLVTLNNCHFQNYMGIQSLQTRKPYFQT